MSQILPSRPMARNLNRTNSQNGAPRSLTSKSSVQIKNILTAGGYMQLPVAGDNFYVIGATGQLNIKPIGDLPGVENAYWAGTGLDLAENPQEVFTDGEGKTLVTPRSINTFGQLALRNPDASRSLYFEIHAGFDHYIDNRLTFPSSQYSQVSRILYDAYHPAEFGGPAATKLMPDLRGTIITDDNGTQWFAANRVLILVMNHDESAYTMITNTAGDKYVTMCQPQTSAQFPISGDLAIAMSDGSNIGGIITEIYNCLPLITA